MIKVKDIIQLAKETTDYVYIYDTNTQQKVDFDDIHGFLENPLFWHKEYYNKKVKAISCVLDRVNYERVLEIWV